MSSTSEQMARMQRFMALNGQQRALMMRMFPGTVTASDVDELMGVLLEMERLAEASNPEDQLVPRRMVEEQVANITDWIGRGYDALGDAENALVYFELALSRYSELGDTSTVSRLRDKIGEVRLHCGQDVDAELRRLMGQVDEVEPNSMQHAKTLIALGELRSLAGDDYGALEVLEKARVMLDCDEFRLPDASEMLAELSQSLNAIESGAGRAGPSAIEAAMQRRMLHKRLLFALSKAYSTTDQATSVEYAQRLERLDEQTSSMSSREALLEAVKKLGF